MRLVVDKVLEYFRVPYSRVTLKPAAESDSIVIRESYDGRQRRIDISPPSHGPVLGLLGSEREAR